MSYEGLQNIILKSSSKWKIALNQDYGFHRALLINVFMPTW